MPAAVITSSKTSMDFEPSNEDLQQFRDWLRKMPHLVQDYDDQFLAAFIRASKGSLQKAKLFLENFSGIRITAPDFFETYDPLYPILQEYLSVWLTFPLPERTSDGSIVIFTCLNPEFNDPSKSHKRELYKYLALTVYALMWDNDFGSGKCKLVFDYKGFTLGHVRADFTPMAAKRIIKIAESGVPLRLQSIIFANVPTYVEYVCNLFKRAAKAKLVDRFHVYDTADKLGEHIPRKILPKEYGGCQESVLVLHDNWKKKIESYRERFLEEERKLKELDHLRPPRTNEEDDMAGTFRQLTVD